MITVSILDNSITHAHTYIIMVLCVSVTMHGHLPSHIIKLHHKIRPCDAGVPCASAMFLFPCGTDGQIVPYSNLIPPVA